MSPDKSSIRAKKFMKHVLSAAKRQEDKKKAKHELDKHVKKVKRLTSSKVKKETIDEALKELDEKLKTVLEKEGKLITFSEKSQAETSQLKEYISHLEDKLLDLGKRDIDLISDLKNRIKLLEAELEEAQKERQQSSEKTSELSSNILELKNRLNHLIDIKTQRDKRFEEIEEKIKAEVTDSYQELLLIEDRLNRMEAAYSEMESKGYDKSMLQETKRKIYAYKKKLFSKKAKLEKQMPSLKEHKLPKIKEEQTKLPTEPKEQGHHIKHDLMFGVPAETTPPKDQGKLPPLPPAPKIPKEKKGIIQKIKDIF
ncbi:hypothetical protein GF336_06045 [Candidatus Woesearchaeota archaeon]|nr:hypothetical protein [Candidatus Woesearchaeota archaeon]